MVSDFNGPGATGAGGALVDTAWLSVCTASSFSTKTRLFLQFKRVGKSDSVFVWCNVHVCVSFRTPRRVSMYVRV